VRAPFPTPELQVPPFALPSPQPFVPLMGLTCFMMTSPVKDPCAPLRAVRALHDPQVPIMTGFVRDLCALLSVGAPTGPHAAIMMGADGDSFVAPQVVHTPHDAVPNI
jgi:hypothetical protein